jgi:hypothetical protein
MSAVAVAACLAVAAASPLWAALLMPLLLGAPHLALGAAAVDRAAGGERRWLAPLAPLLAALALLGLWGWRSGDAAAPLLSHLAGAATAFVAARGTRRAALIALPLAAVGTLWPRAFALALAHGHNLVALGAWAWAARARGRRSLPALALCAAGAAAIMLGAFDAALAPWRGAAAAGLSWTGLESALAPGLPGLLAARVVLAYVFLQAVHYAAWLWLIPRDSDAGGWRGFARAAARRWGPASLAVAALAALALPAAAWAGPAQVRSGYLALAAYHAWLELAGAARLAARA